MASRFNADAGAEAIGNIDAERTVDRVCLELRSAPDLARQGERDRAVLRIQADVAAAAVKRDGAVGGLGIDLAGAIIQGQRTVHGAQLQIPVHAVNGDRTVAGLDVEAAVSRSVNDEINLPVP